VDRPHRLGRGDLQTGRDRLHRRPCRRGHPGPRSDPAVFHPPIYLEGGGRTVAPARNNRQRSAPSVPVSE
jgi:hypothetical protein